MMRHLTRMLSTLLVGAMLVGAILAGTGGHAAEGPVKVGILTDFGVFGGISGPGSVQAARMAIDDFGGQVLGQPIGLIAADHLGKTDTGVGLARSWYDSEGVDAIFDISQSAIALGIQQLAREKNKIIIFTGAASSDLTGKACSPNGFSWGYDTYSMTHGGPETAMTDGKKDWFLMIWDYAVGYAFERDITDTITKAGGRVVGTVKVPLGTTDYSAFLLQARASGAQLIGVLLAGADLINAVKQSEEYRIVQGGQTLITPLAFVNDVHAIGLNAAQGMLLSEDLYWDQDDASRAWTKRFSEKMNRPPSRNHGLVYSAVTHYLKAVQKAGTRDTQAVIAAMRSMPVEDLFTKPTMLRADGKLPRQMYLMRVKKPEESKYPWDYEAVVSVIPGERAFRQPADSECPLFKK